MTAPNLDFTGERFTPECVREMRYEHWHRYAFAAPLARGRRVLDAACGEGYGSALLARAGGEVLGVDLSTDAVHHARARYEVEGVRFEVGDATALEHLPGGGFDLIVSFETLEHVEAQDAMLAGFARLLSDDGILLVSSPDRRTYSDLTGYRNEFHVRELYRDELEALLDRHFPARRLYGQKLLFQSALWSVDGRERDWAASALRGEALEQGLCYPPLYFIAACAKREGVLGSLPGLSLFGDAEESVYAHYDAEVRRNIAAGHRIAELEAELEELRRRCDRLQAGEGR